jgi:hypothetical protein
MGGSRPKNQSLEPGGIEVGRMPVFTDGNLLSQRDGAAHAQLSSGAGAAKSHRKFGLEKTSL